MSHSHLDDPLALDALCQTMIRETEEYLARHLGTADSSRIFEPVSGMVQHGATPLELTLHDNLLDIRMLSDQLESAAQ